MDAQEGLHQDPHFVQISKLILSAIEDYLAVFYCIQHPVFQLVPLQTGRCSLNSAALPHLIVWSGSEVSKNILQGQLQKSLQEFVTLNNAVLNFLCPYRKNVSHFKDGLKKLEIADNAVFEYLKFVCESYFSYNLFDITTEQEVDQVQQGLDNLHQGLDSLMNQLLLQNKFTSLLNEAVSGLLYETAAYRHDVFRKQVLEFLKGNA